MHMAGGLMVKHNFYLKEGNWASRASGDPRVEGSWRMIKLGVAGNGEVVLSPMSQALPNARSPLRQSQNPFGWQHGKLAQNQHRLG
jgi:hypothetical protein